MKNDGTEEIKNSNMTRIEKSLVTTSRLKRKSQTIPYQNQKRIGTRLILPQSRSIEQITKKTSIFAVHIPAYHSTFTLFPTATPAGPWAWDMPLALIPPSGLFLFLSIPPSSRAPTPTPSLSFSFNPEPDCDCEFECELIALENPGPFVTIGVGNVSGLGNTLLSGPERPKPHSG